VPPATQLENVDSLRVNVKVPSNFHSLFLKAEAVSLCDEADNKDKQLNNTKSEI
jgi:hypothetical protein